MSWLQIILKELSKNTCSLKEKSLALLCQDFGEMKHSKILLPIPCWTDHRERG